GLSRPRSAHLRVRSVRTDHRAPLVPPDRWTGVPALLARPRHAQCVVARFCGRDRDRRKLAHPGDTRRARRLGCRRTVARTRTIATDGAQGVGLGNRGAARETNAKGWMIRYEVER